MSSSGAPTRDVLLVSAIITVSLSVTIVLCGLCHWCQRKLVRLLWGDPLGLGLTLLPLAILQSLTSEFYGVPKQMTCLPTVRDKCTELRTTSSHILTSLPLLGSWPCTSFYTRRHTHGDTFVEHYTGGRMCSHAPPHA